MSDERPAAGDDVSAPSRTERLWFAALLVAFIALALAYSTIIRLGYGPDEPRHYRFVVLMMEQHKLPRVLPDGRELGRAIAIHPPLYYSILSVFYFPAQWLGGDWFTQRLFRLLSALFGAAVLTLVWRAARTAFPDRPGLALFIPAVIGFWPHFLLDHSVINNDNGANLAGALFVYFLVRRLSGEWTIRAALIAGLLLGIGANMKGQLLICLPPAFVCIAAWDHGRRFYRNLHFWRTVGLALAVWLVLVAPWYGRNLVLYGKINYVASGYEGIPAGVSFATAWSEGIIQQLVARAVAGVFRSIWVQVGWFPESISGGLYAGLGVLLAAAAAGWAWLLLRLRRGTLAVGASQRRQFAAFFLPFAFIYVLILYVATFIHMGVAEGGRYAMFALSGFAAWLAVGWRSLAPLRLRAAGATVVLAFVLLLNAVSMWHLVTYLNPTYAPGTSFWTPILN